MKIAPLALYNALENDMNPEPFLSNVMALGLQTHGDPRASFGAVSVAATIKWLLHHDPNHHCLCGLLDHTFHMVDIVESRYRFYRRNDDALSARLHTAFSAMFDVPKLETVIGAGCFTLESVPFALATFHRNPIDFRKGVLEAVNAGGDTDTTAAMVGAMIGAHVGIDGIPPEWVERVDDCGRAIVLANDMCDALKHP